jgi:predicted ATP-grasp superfamily ATP-dependent carboligase
VNAPCLVVATTGRALARSAARAAAPGGAGAPPGGSTHRVCVLDLFADRDTQRLASACQRLPARGIEFDAAATLAAATDFCPPPAPLVTGSGFERHPALISALARGRELLGNCEETVAASKDPHRFCALLAALAIPHPATTLLPPRDPAGWLVKTVGGCGGTHVRAASDHEAVDATHYFQRRVDGTVASALFLADGRRACIVGCNEQWVAGGPATPFAWGGAINRVRLPPGMRARLAADIDALVGALGLVGLNGIDFIVNGNDYAVLELNPRPPATIDLHDDHAGGSLFDLHLRACRGELPQALPQSETVRAQAVVYAPRALRIAPGFRFPDWCSDLPASSESHAPGMPVCMVHAAGSGIADVRQLVQRRRRELEDAITELAA